MKQVHTYKLLQTIWINKYQRKIMNCEVKCHAAILSQRVCFIRWEMQFRFIASCTLHGTDSQGWCGQGHDLAFRKQILRAWMNALEIRGKWGGEHAKKTRLEDLPWERGHSSHIMRQLQPASHCVSFWVWAHLLLPLSFLSRTKARSVIRKMHGNNAGEKKNLMWELGHWPVYVQSAEDPHDYVLPCLIGGEVAARNTVKGTCITSIFMTLTLIPLLLVSLFPHKHIQWSRLKDCAVAKVTYMLCTVQQWLATWEVPVLLTESLHV
jgi:hypothetical protein